MPIDHDEPYAEDGTAKAYWLTYQDLADRKMLLSSGDKNLLLRRGYELCLISGKSLLLWEHGNPHATIIWVIRAK